MQIATAVSTRQLTTWLPMECAPQRSGIPQKRLFSHMSEGELKQMHDDIGDDDKEFDGPAIAWEEEEVVQLCWLLLKSINGLQDPQTPIIEKIWILNWIFSDPTQQSKPFSFDFCVRVVCVSPLSELPFIGEFPIDDLRDVIQDLARRWVRESVSRFPDWIQKLIRANPDWIVAQLDKDPQYINKQIRSHESSPTGDLFTLG